MIVETDASDYMLAAIISSRTPDSEIHPITFHSHSFNPAEVNYDTHDKELLAIFEAFKHWCQYLEGSSCYVLNSGAGIRRSNRGVPTGVSGRTWLQLLRSCALLLVKVS